MAWCKSGLFESAQQIFIVTCDVCERDIGYEDGCRAREHFRISHQPNAGAIDDLEPAVSICSWECLRAFAANTPGPDRALSFWDRRRLRGKRPAKP